MAVVEHDEQVLFNPMLAALTEDHDPQTMVERQLVERLTLLFWREIRLAKADLTLAAIDNRSLGKRWLPTSISKQGIKSPFGAKYIVYPIAEDALIICTATNIQECFALLGVQDITSN